jgi:purine-binding chemotaxis protein CheW
MNAYVRFRVADEAYAVSVSHVLEVSDLGDVTPVPGARREVLGVRNLRGKILPVIDLAALLGTRRTAPPGRLLVAESDGRQAGLAIDEVTEVGELGDPAEDADSPLLLGTMLTDGDLIGVVNMPAVLDALGGPSP